MAFIWATDTIAAIGILHGVRLLDDKSQLLYIQALRTAGACSSRRFSIDALILHPSGNSNPLSDEKPPFNIRKIFFIAFFGREN
jgi:hypothetical protein